MATSTRSTLSLRLLLSLIYQEEFSDTSAGTTVRSTRSTLSLRLLLLLMCQEEFSDTSAGTKVRSEDNILSTVGQMVVKPAL